MVLVTGRTTAIVTNAQTIVSWACPRHAFVAEAGDCRTDL